MEWESFFAGLFVGHVLGIELCIFLKNSAERRRWPYNKRRNF